MKRILVPCDFSKPAVNAFRLALDIAAQSKGTVHLFHVIELPVVGDPGMMQVVTMDESFFRDSRKSVQLQFEKLLAKHGNADVKTTTTIEFGFFPNLVVNAIENNSIDLVLMGSHGSSGFKEFISGSNAERIVRKSSVPVLVVKDLYKGAIRNIVFPNTLETEGQEELTKQVKALQAFFKATVHIVYINTPSSFTSDTVTMKRLKEFAKRFMFKDYTINVFNHENEEGGILHFSETIGGHLIALGTHGRRGVSHLLNGSLAEDLVNHSKTLIWTAAIK
ncbi:universal stress protein [Chryseolinea sp. T2]|uniref:universal stress protein n=1 Tax=Chryseolinea sp. T2 TaxID=3129255 RepID=UPI003077BD0B